MTSWGCPSTQEIVTLTATFSVTSTCPFLEREAQFSALAQDQHRWQALCDAVGFEIIGEILREDDDPASRSMAQAEARHEQSLHEKAVRLIAARGHADFGLRELRNELRTGHINSALALAMAYRMGRADEARARGAILDPVWPTGWA